MGNKFLNERKERFGVMYKKNPSKKLEEFFKLFYVFCFEIKGIRIITTPLRSNKTKLSPHQLHHVLNVMPKALLFKGGFGWIVYTSHTHHHDTFTKQQNRVISVPTSRHFRHDAKSPPFQRRVWVDCLYFAYASSRYLYEASKGSYLRTNFTTFST